MIVYDGLNNLAWFIGIVEEVGDPTNNGRVKVRAFGFHPTLEENTVETSDLPWAFVLTSSPHMHVPLDRGELVFGAFLDGRDAQQPLVFGVIPTPKFGVPVTAGGGAADSGQLGGSAVAANYPKTGIGPLSAADMANLSSAILNRESSGDYKAVNTLGYVGGYQFGAAALTDLGYVKQGTTNRQLQDPNVWTGQNGVSSLNSFLESPATQDQAYLDLTQRNYDSLLRRGVIDPTSNPTDVAGYLAAAHLLGPGGVSAGLNGTDAYGTSGSDYFNLGSKAVSEGYAATGPAGSPIPSTNPYLKNNPEVIDNFGNKALPPQATGEDVHKTPIAPAMNNARNYASTDTAVYHPGVPLGGSYKTGVWNARYDGSYIEMHAGASRDQEHINVVHRSGSHITLDQNGNITISSTGRVHISSANDLEQNVEGYSTNVSKGGYAILVDGGGLSLTSTGDINIRSNSNINLGAGGNIFMTSGGAFEVAAPKIGMTAEAGIISLAAGQNIAMQSAGDITSKAKNMAMNASAKIGVSAAGDLTVKAANLVLASEGNLHQKGNGVVLEGSTMGIKSAGYATIQAGGFANIVGSQVHLNDGGSVDSVDVPDVLVIDDTQGAVKPQGPAGSPPPMGVGSATSKLKAPKPGSIAVTDTDDLV